MKTLQMIAEAIGGALFGVVLFVFMFLAALILTIPEIPKVIRTHAM